MIETVFKNDHSDHCESYGQSKGVWRPALLHSKPHAMQVRRRDKVTSEGMVSREQNLKHLEGKFHQYWQIWVRLERELESMPTGKYSEENQNFMSVYLVQCLLTFRNWSTFSDCESFYTGAPISLLPPGQNIFNPIHTFTWCLLFSLVSLEEIL